MSSPPRFKQNVRKQHYAYLGDNVKFKCTAVGRPAPKVHWYRDGKYLDFNFFKDNPHKYKDMTRQMSFEIRRIEVSDKGNWMCKVWNNEGSVTRNFTLNIIDFCDYFQHPQFQRDRIPKECLCQWAISGGAPIREDSDLPQVTHEECLKYDKANQEVIKFRRPVNETCVGGGCEPIYHTRYGAHIHDESKPRYIVQTDPDPILHPSNLNKTDDTSAEDPSDETTPSLDVISDESPSNRNISRRHKPESHVHDSTAIPELPDDPQKLVATHENSDKPSDLIDDSKMHETSSEQEHDGHAELRASPDTILDVEAKLEKAKEILDKRPDLIKPENEKEVGEIMENKVETDSTAEGVENKKQKPFAPRTITDPPGIHPEISKNVMNGASSKKPRLITYPLGVELDFREVQDSIPSPSTDTTTDSWLSGQTSTDPTTTTSSISPTTTQFEPVTLRRWYNPNKPSIIAPYFTVPTEQGPETVVSPAGRTLKLQCKAAGQPEPQVMWRKENIELHRDTERKTGSLYKIRRWSLEMEDVSESDSGNYECEVWNHQGTIKKQFRVEVRDRLRSKPIIVPNVLINKTVDVNSTVNFTCEVISDLVPHVIWIKLLNVNGSYIKWDEHGKPMFNFLEMKNVKKARTYHNNVTKTYALELVNVTLDDQGIYACVAGNSLGMSMGNATLTVNEFKTTFLPTEQVHPPWPITYWILLAVAILLLIAFFVLAVLYLLFSKKFGKNRIQNFDKFAVRKKVIITKKPTKEGELWSDPASSYAITIEPVIGEALPRDRERDGMSSEMTMLTDYEVPTDQAWEIDRSRLKLAEILGEGAFGEVWKGILRPKYAKESDKNAKEIPVAVKKLKPSAQEKELIILVSEMQIFKSIGDHKNILKLIGCCTGFGPLYVILELCPHGNLRDFLRKHRPRDDGTPYPTEENSRNYLQPKKCVIYQNLELPGEIIIKNLTLRDLVRFSTEIARGMEFLAAKKIIHRDLAARNILVAADFSMKISDFGLSRNVFYNDYYRKKGPGRIPIKWMAPEALDKNLYTVYSDVWSYGIVLWEIMTLGGTPYPSIAMPQLYNILKQGYRMESPHNCPEEIYGVMVMCWQEKPETRPNFTLIADYFDWMLAEAANYNANVEADGSATPDDDNSNRMIYSTPKSARKRKARPLSAPGMMSFEAFASNVATTSHSEAVVHHSPIEQETNLDNLPSPMPMTESSPLLSSQVPDEQAPDLPQKPLRRNQSTDVSSLKSKRKIAEHFYINCSGHSSSNGGNLAEQSIFVDSAIGSPLWSSNTEYEVYKNDGSGYEQSEHDSRVAKRTNSDGSEKHKEEEPLLPPRKDQRWSDINHHIIDEEPMPSTSNTLPHQASTSSRLKNPLIRQDRFSDSSAYEGEFAVAYPPSTSDQSIPRKESKNLTTDFMMRSQSVDSQTSSGRGGSSAMSSAEGLGGLGDFCKIEYAEIMPMLKMPSPQVSRKKSNNKLLNKFPI